MKSLAFAYFLAILIIGHLSCLSWSQDTNETTTQQPSSNPDAANSGSLNETSSEVSEADDEGEDDAADDDYGGHESEHPATADGNLEHKPEETKETATDKEADTKLIKPAAVDTTTLATTTAPSSEAPEAEAVVVADDPWSPLGDVEDGPGNRAASAVAALAAAAIVSSSSSSSSSRTELHESPVEDSAESLHQHQQHKHHHHQPHNFANSNQSPVDFAALKADHDLMSSLTDYLSRFGIKLPKSLVQRVDETDLCAENAFDGLKYYCLKMDNGQYYDPWNPWCGYIDCKNGAATRRGCRPGTWMGMRGTGSESNMFLTKDAMCRRPLRRPINDRQCDETTDFDLCGRTKQMEANGNGLGQTSNVALPSQFAAALKPPSLPSVTDSSPAGPSVVSFKVESETTVDLKSLAS